MTKIMIEIETGNAAFEDYPMFEVARILKKLASDMEHCGHGDYTIHDINGNPVGFCREVKA